MNEAWGKRKEEKEGKTEKKIKPWSCSSILVPVARKKEYSVP